MAPNRVVRMYEEQLDLVEADVVGLARAVAPAVYDFVPPSGEFAGARTFGEQVRHLSTVLQLTAAVMIGSRAPFPPGTANNGPEGIADRDRIIAFLEASFRVARDSLQTLTEQNHMERVPSLFGPVPRAALAAAFLAHSYNHYGQMVVYARMNGVVPPGSVPFRNTEER